MYINRLGYFFLQEHRVHVFLHCTLVEVEAGSRVKKMKVMGRAKQLRENISCTNLEQNSGQRIKRLTSLGAERSS